MAQLIDGPAPAEVQTAGDGALVNIFASAKGLDDPNPFYRQLRDESPVHLSSFGGVVLSRYDDCRIVLRDGRFGKGGTGPGGAFGGSSEVVAFRRQMQERRRERPVSMLDLDPPAHSRQRALVSRAFTPRRIEELRPRIAALVEERLDAMAETGGGDAVALLADPLPVSVISEMLGVPRADWARIRTLVSDLAQVLEPSANIEELERAAAASDSLWQYFTQLVAERRRSPADDLLSGLIEASDGSDQLSEGEILAVANLLFAAGAETTTNLIGNGLNALFNHPDQLDRLWSDPSLVASAVEEMLRFDSPVQLDGRACLAPAEVAGVSFEPGDRVLTLLGSANRDPAHFDQPDHFDLGRFNPARTGARRAAEPVMSFASGIHYCLGANLARAEAHEVFAGLIRRFSAISPDGDRPYRRRLVLRGLERCPVKVTPR
jgi:cytochrome P450